MSSRYIKVLFLLSLFIQGIAVIAQKTDKVRLKNGDNITGEIKSMKLAMLSFKMDGPGTISIKWEEVVGIKSDKVFEFTLRSGRIIIGKLDSLFMSQQSGGLDDIVEIIPIKDRFLSRLVGDLNIGFNYTKSSENLQFNLSSNITYKMPKLELGLKFSSVITNQGSASDSNFSKKQDASFSLLKSLDKRFYLGSAVGWQQNSQLGLANRYLLSGTAGMEPLTNNHNRLLLATGLSFNLEQSVENKVLSGNLDAIFLAQFKRFYYSTPKLSIDAYYVIYPGLTDWGRIRMEFDLDVSVEIFKDFLVGLTFYDNYDNRPPKGAFSKNDFGINFKVGYQFGK
jgi:Protein of unknown function, DUF481